MYVSFWDGSFERLFFIKIPFNTDARLKITQRKQMTRSLGMSNAGSQTCRSRAAAVCIGVNMYNVTRMPTITGII